MQNFRQIIIMILFFQSFLPMGDLWNAELINLDILHKYLHFSRLMSA